MDIHQITFTYEIKNHNFSNRFGNRIRNIHTSCIFKTN